MDCPTPADGKLDVCLQSPGIRKSAKEKMKSVKSEDPFTIPDIHFSTECLSLTGVEQNESYSLEIIENSMRYTILLLMSLVISGCANGCKSVRPKSVDVVFVNLSTHDLNGVKIEHDDRELGVGMMMRGGGGTLLDVGWPMVPNAKVTFIDQHTRNPYSINVSLVSVNEQVQSGKCQRVLIRIMDYDKADVVCE